jgi:hypothetical protein
MTAESIPERINQKPFRPVALFIYDRMKTTCVVLFDPEGRKFIYEPEQITAIEAR